jgi:glutathione synthase/RimK-type ligase-like ATP-grasp enzyme
MRMDSRSCSRAASSIRSSAADPSRRVAIRPLSRQAWAVSRICFVTCERWPAVSASDRLAQRALEARGAGVEGRAWNRPGADFDGFDAVVLRSNWDYHYDPDGFRDWLARLERSGARIWNPPALVRWNLSKRYLLDLRAAGVPTVPTRVLEDATRAGLEAVMAAPGWSTVVVKPEISASAHGTRRVTRETVGETAAALEAGELRRPLLVQPFVAEIRTRGEWSLIFIDGDFTHAVLKRPGPDDFRVQSELGGSARADTPPAEVLACARAALAALPRAPLYARIDGVETQDGFVVMEVEVNEPGLFFNHAPPAADRFAEALLRAL